MPETRKRRRTQRSASRGPTLAQAARTCPACKSSIPDERRFCPSCAVEIDVEGAAAAATERGTLIDNRYRILETLGEGGMGAVFRVEHIRMGKIMALKLLRRELTRDRSSVERFEQEAKIVSRLSHPNTVSVFDFGELADHGLYMAMEYVPGPDLHRLLDDEGALPEPRAIGIAIQVLHSLAEAHDAGIIHRDVKPANVMLVKTREGADFVKVVDFGIAKLAGPGRSARGITDASGEASFIGTPEYVSPEQARGEALDARSDLYSLAAMLFEITTGTPLFDGPTVMAVVSKHLSEPPPSARATAPAADLSEGFDEVLQKALAKRPEDRYRSADEMCHDLSQLADRFSQKLVLPPARSLSKALTVDEKIARRTDWDQFERSLRRSSKIRAGVGASIALVALAGAAVMTVALTRQAPGPTTPTTPVREEREPNNSIETANRILPSEPVRGTIGRRLSKVESDLDYYVFDVPEGKTTRIEVSAVPNVNVGLDLFAGETHDGKEQWRALAKIDDQPIGSELPEVMDDLALAAGRYAVRVRDVRGPGETKVHRPRENSSDPYTLTVALSAPGPLGEREPNNTLEEARATSSKAGVSSAVPLLGHTGGFAPRQIADGVSPTLWSDDYFEVALSPGAHHACALLVGVEGARLRLQLPSAGEPARRTLAASAGGGQIASGCAPVSGGLLVRVDLESGAQYLAPYLLTVIDDGESGTEGLQRAGEWLTGAGRGAEARALSSRALVELTRAATADATRRPGGRPGARTH